MSKKRIEAICAAVGDGPSNKRDVSPAPQPRQVETIRLQDVPRSKSKPKTKPDARLRQLDSLHERTQVTENLKLPPGRRIKLEDNAASHMKYQSEHLAASDSDVEIVSENGADTHDIDLTKDDSSDEDLPDARQLLTTFAGSARQAVPHSDPLESNYSNSEVDSLIRSVAVDGSKAGKAANEDANDPSNWLLQDTLGDATGGNTDWPNSSPPRVVKRRPSSELPRYSKRHKPESDAKQQVAFKTPSPIPEQLTVRPSVLAYEYLPIKRTVLSIECTSHEERQGK